MSLQLLNEIFSQVLQMSITSSYIIIFILLLRVCMKKLPKNFSYALWSIAAFRLICPFTYKSDFNVFKGDITGKFAPENLKIAQSSVIPPWAPLTEVPAVVNPVQSAPLSPIVIEASPDTLAMWMGENIFSLVWIFGIILMISFGLYSYAKFQKKLIYAEYQDGVYAYTKSQDKLLYSKYQFDNIYICENLKSAFLLGVFKPKIYLPKGLNESEQAYILLHEQIHMQRSDHLIRIISYLILIVHWFNPFVWIAFFLSGKDMEMSCDEMVIKHLGMQSKKEYSTLLLNISDISYPLYATPLAFAEGDTKSRIKNIVKYKKSSMVIISLTGVALILTGVLLITDPVERKQDLINTITEQNLPITAIDMNSNSQSIQIDNSVVLEYLNYIVIIDEENTDMPLEESLALVWEISDGIEMCFYDESATTQDNPYTLMLKMSHNDENLQCHSIEKESYDIAYWLTQPLSIMTYSELDFAPYGADFVTSNEWGIPDFDYTPRGAAADIIKHNEWVQSSMDEIIKNIDSNTRGFLFDPLNVPEAINVAIPVGTDVIRYAVSDNGQDWTAKTEIEVEDAELGVRGGFLIDYLRRDLSELGTSYYLIEMNNSSRGDYTQKVLGFKVTLVNNLANYGNNENGSMQNAIDSVIAKGNSFIKAIDMRTPMRFSQIRLEAVEEYLLNVEVEEENSAFIPTYGGNYAIKWQISEGTELHFHDQSSSNKSNPYTMALQNIGETQYHSISKKSFDDALWLTQSISVMTYSAFDSAPYGVNFSSYNISLGQLDTEDVVKDIESSEGFLFDLLNAPEAIEVYIPDGTIDVSYQISLDGQNWSDQAIVELLSPEQEIQSSFLIDDLRSEADELGTNYFMISMTNGSHSKVIAFKATLVEDLVEYAERENEATEMDIFYGLTTQDYSVEQDEIINLDNEIITINFAQSFVNLYRGAVAFQQEVPFTQYIANANLLRYADELLKIDQRMDADGKMFGNYGFSNIFRASEDPLITYLEDNLIFFNASFEFEGSGNSCEMLIEVDNGSLKIVDFYFGGKGSADTFATGHPAVREVNNPNIWNDEEWVNGVFERLDTFSETLN